MAKKEYAEGSFGAYFVKLIKDHDYSQAKFASDLGVSKTYGVSLVQIWCNILCDTMKNIKRYAITPSQYPTI